MWCLEGRQCGFNGSSNLKHSHIRRNIHLFDIFDNICEPDPEIDGEHAIKTIKELVGKNDLEVKGRLIPLEGVYDSLGGKGTLDENRHLLEGLIGYDRNNIHYHKGWFQDTYPRMQMKLKK